MSEAHYHYVLSALDDGRRSRARDERSEVASYAHYWLPTTAGTELRCYFADISAKALQLGRRMADAAGTQPDQLVAGDFHALPSKQILDLIYITAIHHTWKYEIVISELQRASHRVVCLLLNEPRHRECCLCIPHQSTGISRSLSALE